MGLLDELQEEARELEQRRDVAAVEDRARTALAEEKLRPRLQAAYCYFESLIESVRVVAPEVCLHCELPGFGRVGELNPSEYRIWLNTPDDFPTFVFGYDSVSSSRFECQLNDKVAENVRKTLAAENIRCGVQSSSAGVSRMILEPTIPVRFELYADPTHGVVRLRVRNLDRLGVVEYSYRPEQVTEELMEELGKRMLGKPNRFKELSGDVVEASRRDALKSENARDQRRTNAELGGLFARLWWWLGEGLRRISRRSF